MHSEEILKFKTREEMAGELGISARTLQRYIKQLRLDIPPRCLLGPNYQKIIKSNLQNLK